MTAVRSRLSERGQIMPLLALTIATMGVMAMVAITFGQAMVRRYQAQMVVDAAAFAGASEQAKGLNTIARINEKELAILNGIVLSQKVPFYMDSDDTTWSRIFVYGIPNDWAEENWESFQGSVFDRLNHAIDSVNIAYRVDGIPAQSAERIVNDNFGAESTKLFHDESPPESSDQGTIVPLPEKIAAHHHMLNLTEPSAYDVGGERIYVPYFDNYAVTCDPMDGLNVVCDAAKLALVEAYWTTLELNESRALAGDHPTYHLGKFYDNDTDVRFTYFLRVPAVSPVVAKTFFNQIPPIVVVASAKPYQGRLGADFDPTMSWVPPDPTGLFFVGQFEQKDGREISMTYKAKLIQVRTAEKFEMWLEQGGDGIMRYVSILH